MVDTKINNALAGDQRNAGIDLLRLVAMFMVVLLQCTVYGGVMANTERFSAGYYAILFLNIAAKCAVDCFGLITGYVCVNAKHKPSRLFGLWLQVFLYSLGITVIFALAQPGTVSRQELLLSLIPGLRNEYWYFTSYFCLFLFIPVLNMLIHRLGGKQNTFLIALLVALFCGVALVGKYTGAELGVGGGFTPLWLAVLYYIGAYLKIYGNRIAKKLTGVRCVFGYVFAVAACFAVKLLLEKIGADEYFGTNISDIASAYNSPLLVLAAVCLLLLFAGLEMKKGAKLIARLSAATFGVYLISAQHIFRSHFITGRFSALANGSWWMMAGKMLLGALIIFAFCLAVDFIRSLLFRILPIGKICNKIDSIARRRLPTQPF